MSPIFKRNFKENYILQILSSIPPDSLLTAIITIQLCQSHLPTHFRNETDAERFVHIIPNRKVSSIQSRKAASQFMPIIPVYV